MSDNKVPHLHSLIRSLSGPEKRYFKIFASRHIIGNKNDYMLLFEAMVKQRVFNEPALIETFSDYAFTRHFSRTKNYLYNLLLKSLNSFYSGISVDSDIKEELRHVEILFEKAQYAQCESMLKRIKKKAAFYEKHLQLLEALRWEERIMLAVADIRRLEHEIMPIHDERRWILNVLNNISEYRTLSANLSMLIAKKGENIRDKKELRAFDPVFGHPLMKSSSKALSSEALGYYYQVKGTYFFLKKDYINSHRYREKLLGLLEEKKEQLIEGEGLYHRYIYVMENLMLISSRLRKFDSVEKNLVRLRSSPFTSSVDRARIFAVSFQRELDMYIRLGEFKKGAGLIKEIKKGFEKYGSAIDNEHKLLLWYNIACTFHGAGEYNEALAWLNKILNSTKMKIREDIFCFSHMLNLIVHFELGNTDLLDYIIKSTYHYLHKRNKLYAVETHFFTFLKKLKKAENRKKFKDLLKDLRQKLIPLASNPFEKVAFEYFDFIAWLTSKIENKTFSEAIKERSA